MLTGEIDYRYFNMDTKRFVPGYQDLVQQVGPGATMRCVTNNVGQVLYAAGQREFSQCCMILTCRRLSFGTATGA